MVQEEWEARDDPNKKLKVECATVDKTKYCNLTVTGDDYVSLTGTYIINKENDSPSPDKSVHKVEGTDYEHPLSFFFKKIPKFLAGVWIHCQSYLIPIPYFG